MACIQIGFNLLSFISLLATLIVLYYTIKTYWLNLNKNIYKENFEFDYKNLFEYKVGKDINSPNYELRSDKFDILKIIDFIELLHIFIKNGNKFKSRNVNNNLNNIYKEACKIIDINEEEKIIELRLYDEDYLFEFYKSNKNSFISFKNAFKVFYKSIFNTI